MRKSILTVVVAALAFAVAGPAFASHAVKPKPRPVIHRHARDFGVLPNETPEAAPRPLDHRDPTRPGGIDPSFHPSPT